VFGIVDFVLPSTTCASGLERDLRGGSCGVGLCSLATEVLDSSRPHGHSGLAPECPCCFDEAGLGVKSILDFEIGLPITILSQAWRLTILSSLDWGLFMADIVDTAVAAGSFKTLVAAVQAAGLVATLKSAGPFTVFAPTDAAFAKLPVGTVENLLLPENKDKLVAVLTYHVVPGKVMAADVVKLTEATTVQGSKVKISTDGGVRVDDANVTTTDIACDNGVIHIIDAVILPH
jgi:hypothetical protein